MQGRGPAVPRRIWLLVAAVWAAALLLLGLVLQFPAAPLLHPPVPLPWPLVAALLLAGEAVVVHVEYQRESHTFSLSGLVVGAGLFLVAPATLPLAHAAGGAALYLARRRPLVKTSLNVGNFMLETAIGVLLFRLLAAGADPLSGRAWVAALVATQLGAVVGILVVSAAICLAERRWALAQVVHTAGVVFVGTGAVTLLALTGVVTVATRPAATWLLLSTWLLLLATYRAAVRSRERQQRLGFLYETARRLHGGPQVEAGLAGLLAEAQRRLRAGVAEVTLLPSRPGASGLRTVSGPDGASERMHSVVVPPEEYAELPADGTGEPVLVGADDASDLARSLHGRGIVDAIVAPLYDDGGLIGTVLVGNRLGSVTTGFGEDERRLFATLASQVSLALENDRLERALRELTLTKEELHHQALHDPLTGLANRRLFGRRVEEALAAAATGGCVAVLFVDLDDFKTVNDTLGHEAGDELLVRVAELLRPCLRAEDTPARLGGDEFGVCLAPLHDLAEATEIAARVLAALSVPLVVDGHPVEVRASIGIATSGAGPVLATDLLRQADVAMYSAKLSGKACFEVFDAGMQEQVSRRHALTADLRHAAARGEMEVHYQPIVTVTDGAVVGVEALLRWRHPRRGVVPPDEFVALAEEMGLIGEIGQVVLREAAGQVARWRDVLGRDLFLAVNVSPHQLRSPHFAADVAAALAGCGLPSGALVLEMTETATLADPAAAAGVLEGLRATGVRLAIDDFGTGYSGLHQLQQLPVDIIKIAKEFVDGLLWDNRDAALARAMVHLAHLLGISVVAEGVERPEQVDRLAEVGCDLAQGFYYSRPLPADQAELALREEHPAPAVAGNVIPMPREGRTAERAG